MGALADLATKIESPGALASGRTSATAEAVRAAGIPDALNRWLTMTPAQLLASEAAVRQQVQDFRNRSTTMKAPAPGSKEAQVRGLRVAGATPPAKPQQPRKGVASTTTSGNTPTRIAPPAQPAQPQETTMSKKPKAAKAAKAKKPKTPKAAKPAAAGERARYDWNGAAEKAAKGLMPPLPDFSAPTHDRFRKLIEEVAAAAKAPLPTGTSDADAKKAKIAALRKVEITPTSSTPKALARYRDLCVEAVKAA